MANQVLQAKQKPDGRQFNYILDVFTKEAQERIYGRYLWQATADAAKASDVNVRLDNGVTIEPATATVPPAFSGSAYPVQDVAWGVWVKDIFEVYKNHWYDFYASYHHVRTDRVVVNNTDMTRKIPFDAQSAMVVDGFKLDVDPTFLIVNTNGTTSSWNANNASAVANATAELTRCAAPTVHLEDDKGIRVGNSFKYDVAWGVKRTMFVSGLNASLAVGRYYIVITFPTPVLSKFTFAGQFEYKALMYIKVFAYDAVGDPQMQALVYTPAGSNRLYRAAPSLLSGSLPSSSSAKAITFYGQKGFKMYADVWRTLSFKDAPSKVAFFLKSKDPLGTSLTSTLYSTSNDALVALAGVTGWTSHGLVKDGDEVATSDVHYRIHLHLGASPLQDKAPFVEAVTIDAEGHPTTYSQHPVYLKTDGVLIGISNAILNKVTHANSALSFNTGNIIDGRMVVSFSGSAKSTDILTYPRKTRCVLRQMVDGSDDDIVVAQGRIDNIKLNGKFVNVYINNTPSISAKAKVPSDKHKPFDAGKGYVVGDYCAYNHVGYRSIAPSTGVTPPNAAYWLDVGTVWVNKYYAGGTHLATIALDIVKNEINIPDRFINVDSFDAVIARLPNRVTQSPVSFTKPESAQSMLKELLLLLECGLTDRGQHISLIPEASLDDPVVTHISSGDYDSLKPDLKLDDEVNAVLVRNAWDGKDFLDGAKTISAELMLKYNNEEQLFSLDARFNLSDAELNTVSVNYINRRKGGRLQLTLEMHSRLEMLFVGDVVTIDVDKAQAHEGIAGVYTMQVIKVVPKDKKGTLILSEVKL